MDKWAIAYFRDKPSSLIAIVNDFPALFVWSTPFLVNKMHLLFATLSAVFLFTTEVKAIE